MSDADPQVLHHRLTAVEKAVEKIGEAVETIAKNTSQLALLEQRHAETRDGLERAFTEIARVEEKREEADGRILAIEKAVPENLGKRLGAIEVAMPGLKEARGWLVAGVLAVFAVVGLATIKLAFL